MPDTDPEPYVENPDHAPSATDVVDQLDTTGLGGTSKLADVAPIFGEDARRTAVEAADALENNGGTHSSGVQNVILPGDYGGVVAHPDEREEARQAVLDRGKELREEGVLSPVEAQTEAFKRGAAPAGGDVRTPADGENPAASGSTGRPSDAGTQKTGPTPGARRGAGKTTDDK